jgi:hypothetical protein
MDAPERRAKAEQTSSSNDREPEAEPQQLAVTLPTATHAPRCATVMPLGAVAESGAAWLNCTFSGTELSRAMETPKQAMSSLEGLC